MGIPLVLVLEYPYWVDSARHLGGIIGVGLIFPSINHLGHSCVKRGVCIFLWSLLGLDRC